MQQRNKGNEAKEAAITSAAEAKYAKEKANALDISREFFVTEQTSMDARQRKDDPILMERKDKDLEKANEGQGEV